MSYKDIAYTLKEISSLDSKYRPKITYQENLFYCNVLSIGQSEFYQSATAGFKPEIKLQAKLLDLTNITHIKYNGVIYKILRIYKKEDIVEITLTSTIIDNKVNGTE